MCRHLIPFDPFRSLLHFALVLQLATMDHRYSIRVVSAVYGCCMDVVWMLYG